MSGSVCVALAWSCAGVALVVVAYGGFNSDSELALLLSLCALLLIPLVMTTAAWAPALWALYERIVTERPARFAVPVAPQYDAAEARRLAKLAKRKRRERARL